MHEERSQALFERAARLHRSADHDTTLSRGRCQAERLPRHPAHAEHAVLPRSPLERLVRNEGKRGDTTTDRPGVLEDERVVVRQTEHDNSLARPVPRGPKYGLRSLPYVRNLTMASIVRERSGDPAKVQLHM